MNALILLITLAANEPVLGDCEGCELVFEGQPKVLTSSARIAPEGEPGEPLVIEGVVRTPRGTVAPNVIVYAYQTDAKGRYPKSDTVHGRLRAWVKTDAKGRYRFESIRPGAYPNHSEPQHVHMHLVEPGRATYFIDDLIFADDPLLTSDARARMNHGRGGEGFTTPKKDSKGTWHVQRDIIVRKNVTPG